MPVKPLIDSEIKFIQGDGNYARIHRFDGSVECVSKTIKYLTRNLSDRFIRVNKSHLINRDFFKCIDQNKNSIVMECGTEIPMSKRKKEGSVAILTGKEDPLKLDDLQKVMHYFGWEYVRIIGGSWEFSNKSLKGNYCYIKQSFGGTYIARIEFSSIQNSKVTKQDVARAKTWFGLFNAIKAHTKSLIYKRDVLGQYTAA